MQKNKKTIAKENKITSVDMTSMDDEDMGIKANTKKEISRIGYENMVEELNFLQHTKSQELSKRITEARDFGDLSENAEYQSALEEKQITDSRISELKTMIANSIVVDQIVKSNVIQYGSNVTIEMPDGKNYTFDIVGSAELVYEDTISKISLDSPIGIAIEGKKKGDICKVKAEKGRYDIKILKVE